MHVADTASAVWRLEQQVCSGMGQLMWLTVSRQPMAEDAANAAAARLHKRTGLPTRAVRDAA